MSNYQLNESKMFADVTDGIAIIINSETGIYYGMNDLGTIVYDNLINGADSGAILDALKAIPGAPATLEESFKKFINRLIEKEVIIEAPASTAEVKIDEELAKEAGFELTFEEYDDAQELLLADPIHEVKEDKGWAPETDSIGYTKEETTEREKKSEE